MKGLAREVRERLRLMLFRLLARPRPTEPWMTDLLRQLMPSREGLFVDVGVNIGQTLVKVKQVDPERAYLGFEPNPACIAFTEQLIEGRGFRNCRIVPAGLSTDTGLVELHMTSSSQTDSAGSTVEGFRSPQQVVYRKTVVCLGPADLPADLLAAKVAFVKIDVEGGELEVLEALRSVIERDRPVILIEVLPCYSAENTDRIRRQEKVEALLRDCGLELRRVIKDGAGRLKALEPIERIGIHGDLTRCDYVAMAPNATP